MSNQQLKEHLVKPLQKNPMSKKMNGLLNGFHFYMTSRRASVNQSDTNSEKSIINVFKLQIKFKVQNTEDPEMTR